MKEKILQFFKDFIKSRNVLFYVAYGIAVLSFIGGIVATAGVAVADCGPLPLVFTLLGLLAFVGLSLIRHEWAAAGAVGVASFFAIVAIICNVYPYYLSAVQDLAMTGINIGSILALPGMGALITSVIMLIVCAIAANVFAWLRLYKKNNKVEPAEQAEEKTVIAEEK